MVLVYRCYAPSGTTPSVYFDKVTFEYKNSLFELPYYDVSKENSNTLVFVFVNSEYNTKTAITAAYDSGGRMIDVGFVAITDGTANITLNTDINKLFILGYNCRK